MAEAGAHQAALLLQAAAEAVHDFQAGRAAPSVPDILHLEKRWKQLPAADTGSVAVEDAVRLLGTEVLEGEPLEFVTREVLAAQGAAGAALLTKRQFLALAHVAEQAQSKAFDLVTAEDAAAPRADPAADRHKKRPPPIRDAHLDGWRIAAAVPLRDGDSELEEAEAEEAPAEQPPGPLGAALAAAQASGSLSRAVSLAGRPLEAGAAALSRHTSLDAGEAAAAAAWAARAHQLHESAATSYQSALEAQEGEAQLEGFAVPADEEAHEHGADEEAAPGEAALPPSDGAVDEFAAKLNGLMDRMSGGTARPPAVEGAAEAGAGADAPARGSWESFGSGGSGRADAAAAAQAPARQPQQQTPPQQQAQQLNEAMIQAAMAAGMTFMQHLQAAGAGGAAVPSPFADINPLRQAAAAAAAAMAASPQPTAGGGSSGGAAPEAAAHGGRDPQQVIAEMLAQLRMGGATPEQLHAAAVSLEQQAQAAQHQQQQHSTGSRAGSVGSASAASAGQQQLSQQQALRGDSQRRSWRSSLDDENVSQQAQPQFRSRDPSASPQKPSRLGPHGAALSAQAARDAADMPPPAPRLRPPTVEGIAGWTPMSADDLQRCQAIFKKKGYCDVGGMARHAAMEYFAKLRMEGSIFHAAWAASDLGGDGRLDCREFCLFVQLLRGAQKGRPLPARLTPEEAAALLGERPMPEAPPALLHIDSAHMRAVLGGGHSRQGSVAEQEHSIMQDFDDDASSVDSGIAESVMSGSVVSLGPRRPGGHPLARPAATHHHRGGLGSVLGAGPSGAAYSPAYARAEAHGGTPQAYPMPSLSRLSSLGAEGAAAAVHSLLEVTVNSAEIKYRKPLSTPIFTLSVRDSLGRLVELPIDTHPGHYRREINMIYAAASVRLTSQLRSIPPGSVLFLEIKHWKADKKRFSTLAWSYAPLEKLVDFGPSAARVRNGPVDLPLLKKPVDLTLRRTRRLTSRAYDLHLTMRGIE